MFARSKFAFVALAAAIPLITGCQSHHDKIAPFRQAWDRADFSQASVEIDALIASECKVDPMVVTASKGRDEAIDIEADDTAVLLLEKGMVNLVQGDAESAVALWRRCRDTLDARFRTDADDFLSGALSATLGDETDLPYTGADYEHIFVRVMLSV